MAVAAAAMTMEFRTEKQEESDEKHYHACSFSSWGAFFHSLTQGFYLLLRVHLWPQEKVGKVGFYLGT